MRGLGLQKRVCNSNLGAQKHVRRAFESGVCQGANPRRNFRCRSRGRIDGKCPIFAHFQGNIAESCRTAGRKPRFARYQGCYQLALSSSKDLLKILTSLHISESCTLPPSSNTGLTSSRFPVSPKLLCRLIPIHLGSDGLIDSLLANFTNSIDTEHPDHMLGVKQTFILRVAISHGLPELSRCSPGDELRKSRGLSLATPSGFPVEFPHPGHVDRPGT